MATPLSPQQAIDRLRAAFGGPSGNRTLHAKGRFYTGTFTATPEATELCRAGHLDGQPHEVTVRWSNAAGKPRADAKPDIRGMAVKFRLPDGTATDLLGQTSPRFPTDDPEVFVAMTEATEKPLTLPLFLARHPGVLPTVLASARAKAISSPASFAEVTFYPIHAYGWLDADGDSARGFATSSAPPPPRPTGWTAPSPAATGSADEMAARLERGPVTHEVWVQVAGAGHDPHRATSVWSGARELLAGRIVVTAPVDDPEGGPMTSSPTVFDPTRVVDGIELSDDPILRYREGAYSESVSRRMKATS